MEDNLSVKSNESLTTSEEFDFVGDKIEINRIPTLNVLSGSLNELKEALTEVLQERDDRMAKKEESFEQVGQSTFYKCSNENENLKNILKFEADSSEKQDKADYDDFISGDIDQDCTIFGGVTYLGAATINAPKSETEIQRNMAILYEQSGDLGIKISISVPCSSQGVVMLYDANTDSVISRYEIHRILFYARGPVDTPEAGCFAFTWSHGETQESAIFQCHVFRCDISEAVSRVSACFAKAFQRVPRSMSSSVTSMADLSGSLTLSEARTLMCVFEVSLEIREDDGKGFYSAVGKDKNGFKLKSNIDKRLCIHIKQVSDNGPRLFIERCFGVLIAAGRHVRHSDMQLLEMKESETTIGSCDVVSLIICANWDPSEPNFELLNTETPKDVKQFMTVAVDLVIRGIQEPVRFLIESAVKIFGQNERSFWYFQRRCLIQQFYLNLKEAVSTDLNEVHYEVLSMETSGELDRNLLNLNLNLSSLIQSPSTTSIDMAFVKEEYYSDGDEPLLSGTGLVSKDCSEDVLDNWHEVLNRWKSTNQRPKQLTELVRLGIPEALRGEVWQRLTGVEDNLEIMESYRLLITKESSCENVIQRDIARTFPAHDFFKEAGGLGQDSLYRVSKAYAAYDTEVGYCQGLSFLAATLLLHMPEEQAFCVLIKMMYGYHLRDLYKDGFDNLYLRLYQLNRLMEEQLGSLWQHFSEHNIETHMFASQWFLTVFTARFPLHFVFHILDVFLLQGIDTIFQIALALLMIYKKELIQLDFEGILKYFRVSLPKRFRSEKSARHLVKIACNIKLKRLKKFEADFVALKDAANNACEISELEQARIVISGQEEEIKMLRDEIIQLKDMLKREVAQAESEKNKNLEIINDYKLVRQRLDGQLCAVRAELDLIKTKINDCEKCCIHTNITRTKFESNSDNSNSENNNLEKVRELELELAQTKLAHVEAECRNQDLTHQLRATELELATTKNSWSPWLSKTLSSIKEAANKRDLTSFSYSHPSIQTPSFISHISAMKQESLPNHKNNIAAFVETRRESLPILKDSQSCCSLKYQN